MKRNENSPFARRAVCRNPSLPEDENPRGIRRIWIVWRWSTGPYHWYLFTGNRIKKKKEILEANETNKLSIGLYILYIYMCVCIYIPSIFLYFFFLSFRFFSSLSYSFRRSKRQDICTLHRPRLTSALARRNRAVGRTARTFLKNAQTGVKVQQTVRTVSRAAGPAWLPSFHPIRLCRGSGQGRG